MPRKKKKKISPLLIRILFIGAIGLMCVGSVYYGVKHFFTEAAYFDIDDVVVDQSVLFIHAGDFSRVKGKNIFMVDIKQIHERITRRYPQVKDLKILRQFPNRIFITAEQRMPFVQIKNHSQVLTLDEYAIIISTTSKQNDKLPLVICPSLKKTKIRPGVSLKIKEIKTALSIIRFFRSTRQLSIYSIKKVDVRNLSKIMLELTNDLVIILDWDQLHHKIKILGLLLAQGKIDISQTKYIDVRSKDPVIRTK
ncbi:MAG: FtsQ-type POTRA domain-containing protein [Candidatus Omnitrophica bacterium]|nr:FtsQ-type POTRA domain-containing protein [Candidatus Omnitrophota bacterium]